MDEGNREDRAMVLQLPIVLVAHILEWVPFSDRLAYFSCNQSLWRESCRDYESLLQVLVVPKPPPPILLNNNFINLQSLDVGSGASDDFLSALESQQALPRLIHLGMVHSLRVTDAGLASLVRNPIRCATLETIDITFCRNTTYGGTFCLRDSLKKLKVLRRQPQWMDGMYSIEIPNEGQLFNTFWADGTYVVGTGEERHSGYLCDLFQWTSEDENHVGVFNQFNHTFDDTLQGLPHELRSFFRPGFSLLRLSGEDSLLGAQYSYGLYPPMDRPTRQDETLVPLGEQRYLDIDGNLLPVDAHDEAARYSQMKHAIRKHLPSLMPPEEIVQLNRLHVNNQDQSLPRPGRVLNGLEFYLHLFMGGTQDQRDPILSHYEFNSVTP